MGALTVNQIYERDRVIHRAKMHGSEAIDPARRILTARDVEFMSSLRGRATPLTAKQLQWWESIVAKMDRFAERQRRAARATNPRYVYLNGQYYPCVTATDLAREETAPPAPGASR